MNSSPQSLQQEAEAFARVWQRVSPDPETSPIQITGTDTPGPSSTLSSPSDVPCFDRWNVFLRNQLSAEAAQWRHCRWLARSTGQRVLFTLSNRKLRRIQRLTAVLFLRSQVWYLSTAQHPAPGRNRSNRQSFRSHCYALCHGTQRLTQSYQDAAAQTEPALSTLFSQLAEELATEQQRLLELLSSI